MIKTTKSTILIIYTGLILFSCNKEEKQLDSYTIIQNSINVHDPNSQWDVSDFKVHIQEPRIGNPQRYSSLKLNNRDKSFELLRNRDSSISKHSINKNQEPITFLDNKVITDTSVIKKYRLQPEKNFVYQKFYYHLLGLPMSLNNNTVQKYGDIGRQEFNDILCYKIEIVLKEEVFSKHWNIYIDVNNYKIRGIEMIFPNEDKKGERLYFEGEVKTNGIKIPRTRHWHKFSDDTYAGSDIIMNLES